MGISLTLMQKNNVIFSNLCECHESSQMNKMWKVTDDVNEKKLNIFFPMCCYRHELLIAKLIDFRFGNNLATSSSFHRLPQFLSRAIVEFDFLERQFMFLFHTKLSTDHTIQFDSFQFIQSKNLSILERQERVISIISSDTSCCRHRSFIMAAK